MPWWVGEGVKPEDVTDKMIEEQIVVILGLRGKRGTDLKTQIKAYSELLKPESAGGGGKVLVAARTHFVETVGGAARVENDRQDQGALDVKASNTSLRRR